MNTKGEFSRITVVGTGLIGGSFALAAKNFFPDLTVVGVDYEEEIKKALRRGAVDEGYEPDDLTDAVAGSDLIVLATPIDEIIAVLKKLPEPLEPGTVVIDLGSTKRKICSVAWDRFENIPYTFIGGHPMTGAEIRGIGAAQPLLFENSVFVLVTPEGEETAVSQKLEGFIRGLGAEPRYMKPEQHDDIVAKVSHLPQLISVSLMKLVGEEDRPEDFLSLAGGGFRDMTRIADSPFEIWDDIFATNGDFVRKEVEDFLRELRETLGKLSGDGLEEVFRHSSRLRDDLPKSNKGLSNSTFKVAVMVPDRTGALGELTTALGENGINIRDLELQKVREDYGGTFQVYFDSLEAAKEANRVLLNQGFESRVID